MKLEIEFTDRHDLAAKLLDLFPAAAAAVPELLNTAVEPARAPEPAPPPAEPAPEPAAKKPGKKRGPKPAKVPEPEEVAPPSPSDDPVGDDLASVDALREQFGDLVINNYDAAEKLIDDLEANDFDDLAEQGRLTELKTAMVERGLL